MNATPDNMLADAEQLIAYLQRELAACKAERDEALQQQTATAEMLQVINSSPGNLAPVFDAMLEMATRLSGAELGILWVHDGRVFSALATCGVSQEFHDYLRANPQPGNPGSDLGRLREGENLVHRSDYATESAGADTPLRRAFVGLGGARSGVLIPLRRGRSVLGALRLYRQQVRPFSDKQIALLQNFAAQAVIAMENARLLNEQREALEQQTATSEVLQVINGSPGDLKPVFDAMLDKAMQLCSATFGALCVWRGERFEFEATHGSPERDFLIANKISPPGSRAEYARVAQGEGYVQFADISTSTLYEAGDPAVRQAVDLGGARTTLTVPLAKDDEVLGLLILHRQEVRIFSDREISLVRNFAAQAVIAMENARLLGELRGRTADLQETLEYQTAISDVLKVISRSAFDLQPVLDTVVETAARLCDADRGAIFRREGDLWRLAVNFGFPPAWEDYMTAQGAFSLDRFSEHVAVRAVVDRHPVHIDDLATVPGYESRLGEQRTTLGVPLLREGEAIGTIVLARLRIEPFTDRQIELVSTFADQAVIAIENSRLLSEQREALEQQTATAEVVQVINASPGNLMPVFDTILEKALQLCGAAFGALATYDGECFQAVAMRGVATGLADAIREPVRPSPGMAYDRIARGAEIVHIADITDDDVYRSGNYIRRALADQGGARTALFVALRGDDALFGAFVIYRKEVRPFSDKQIALLQNFAAQAVIAMENARLLTETREALEQQTATAEVLQVINSSPGDLTPVFDAMLQRATRLCGTAIGSFYSYNGEAFQVLASTVGDIGRTIQPGPGVTLWRIAHGESVVQIADIQTEPAYQVDAIGQMRTRLAGTRTALAVALRKDETLVGAITTGRPEVRPFSDKQIALLQNFAEQAVVAMENARLLTETREALEQQTATAEVLQVINSSPGNVAPVFEVVLEKALRLCEATFGLLLTYDGERIRLAAQHGVPAAFPEFWDSNAPLEQHGCLAARLLETKRPVQTLDLRDGEGYRTGIPLVDLAGGRTLLGVPLLKDGAVVGTILIYRREVRAFSDKQIALLENFAAQAVIAMENARLLHELRVRTDELAQRQAELRVTFENMGDGVAMFDETKHLVAWNRKFQEILDVPDDLLKQNRTYEEHLRFLAARGDFGPGVATVEQITELVATTGQPYGYERTRPDGRVIEIRRNPVPDGGFVLMYSDITERKQNEIEIRAARDAAEEASRTIQAAYRDLKAAQANLIQAEKMASLGQLTAGIAHEIKNPLNFVNNFAELSSDLLDELNDAVAGNRQDEIDELRATLQGNLAKITEHGKRADGIVKAMLEHSRGSSGERRKVDLNALIDEALNLAYHGARAQDQSFNITLERDFGEGIAAIEVNPQDMTRVFLNTFSNGFYATTRRARDGGDAGFVPTLKVTTIDAGEAVEIRVRDNGIGIPAEIKDKLFQPFFTTKPTGEGTGLGLSITYDIVTQQHGGSIAVDSNVGEYSEFTIRLPR